MGGAVQIVIVSPLMMDSLVVQQSNVLYRWKNNGTDAILIIVILQYSTNDDYCYPNTLIFSML